MENNKKQRLILIFKNSLIPWVVEKMRVLFNLWTLPRQMSIDALLNQQVWIFLYLALLKGTKCIMSIFHIYKIFFDLHQLLHDPNVCYILGKILILKNKIIKKYFNRLLCTLSDDVPFIRIPCNKTKTRNKQFSIPSSVF